MLRPQRGLRWASLGHPGAICNGHRGRSEGCRPLSSRNLGGQIGRRVTLPSASKWKMGLQERAFRTTCAQTAVAVAALRNPRVPCACAPPLSSFPSCSPALSLSPSATAAGPPLPPLLLLPLLLPPWPPWLKLQTRRFAPQAQAEAGPRPKPRLNLPSSSFPSRSGSSGMAGSGARALSAVGGSGPMPCLGGVGGTMSSCSEHRCPSAVGAKTLRYNFEPFFFRIARAETKFGINRIARMAR